MQCRSDDDGKVMQAKSGGATPLGGSSSDQWRDDGYMRQGRGGAVSFLPHDIYDTSMFSCHSFSKEFHPGDTACTL
jgi:hypothetical protein